MDKKSLNCLMIYPRFNNQTFWNYRETCELVGAKYPTTPLGLITVAAMFPESWQIKLRDLNVEELDMKDVAWADVIFLGGMIFQQQNHLKLIDTFKSLGKKVVVGGPDPTSSPHLYDKADHLVLGEAEVTFPEFLADFKEGKALHYYRPGERKADMEKSPLPRFELLNFKNYLHVGIQWNRGCPFQCEFCDIIELFGRVPRGKSHQQVLAELQKLHDLGYRGHVEIVDDNFIGNKKTVKALLSHLIAWQKKHGWPFDLSTEASLNLADDEELMGMMREAGFGWIFTGIETPNEETLKSTQKNQNTRRSIADSVKKINQFGMVVHAGYIVGFDNEKGSVSQALMEHIEDTGIPVTMVGLLYALPNTQLTRRLEREGRLDHAFDVITERANCQSTTGLNFETLRPKFEVLKDLRNVIQDVFSAKKYFGRIRKLSARLDCSKTRFRTSLKNRFREMVAFFKLSFKMSLNREARFRYYWVIFTTMIRNPRALNSAISLMALYLHFGKFRKVVLKRLDDQIVIFKTQWEEGLRKKAEALLRRSPASVP